ncbi:four helix bundle protein [Christiangramia salexigens]|uniref:Four helix bundle protein n=1 Tax=Christiangramia salexigens TaxID=1913577 RepID=A0A1L3J5P4_9FLAO|nr:four helix bundle protein [Christiangramia salexigens]APG60433.1 four helix bundle protein [Christiangramia salexigens]
MTHRDLEVYKVSMDLVMKIYELSGLLPTDEKFGLVSQIRRSAVSIPSNISEGAAKSSTKEFIRFLDIANGSLSELETQLTIIERLGLAKTEALLSNDIISIRKMIYRLKQSLNKKL